MNFQETKKFMEDNKEIIIQQYQKKMEKIFSFDKENEDFIEDNATAWWIHVVEPGWTPKILKNVDLYLEDENVETTMNILVFLDDDYAHEALRRLYLPEEIIEM